jgi:hypothetical protein
LWQKEGGHLGRGEAPATPASGAVRLASDSRPAEGRSIQPDEKRSIFPLLHLLTIRRLELFETEFAVPHRGWMRLLGRRLKIFTANDGLSALGPWR